MRQSSGNGEGAIHLVTPDAPPRPVAMIGYHCLQKQHATGEWLANYGQPGPNRWMTWFDRNGEGRRAVRAARAWGTLSFMKERT